MIERRGDLWAESITTYIDPAPWLVIPTNGERKMSGVAVMGAGVAKKAAELFPALPRLLGERLRKNGNHVAHLGTHCLRDGTLGELQLLLRGIVSFPTKERWREMSDLDLIARSAQELVDLVASYGTAPPLIVLLPRVGTGLGGLGWNVVKPVLERHLKDDRYVVLSQ